MRPVLLTHCGAGSDDSVKDAAQLAGSKGLSVLHKGGSALEAVIEAIVVLEDDPRLNAGTGSRMRIDGRVQMDAALMDSRLEAGAVAVIENVRNPIRVARDVLDSPHVLLAGSDATAFARRKGHPFYDPTTPESRRHLEESLTTIRTGRLPRYARKWRGVELHDTVGAVARDRRGRFAAGSSTGGTAFMMPGRVGDSPLIGAGIYAGPDGAVTVTGIGEEVIKRVLSKFVYDLIAKGLSPKAASNRGLALFRDDVPVGIIAVGSGGVGMASNRPMAFFTSSTGRTL
ncbi:MAG TPA: isoaspartyl peptidase/L-asparaginase [Thermoplasmata archaeon]|nr:isoaspartyl peptidase/L-asparaginase [Thermoplasmata archaeon]